VGVDPRAFREAIRKSDNRYPVPLLTSLLLGFGLALVAVARAFDGAIRTLLVGAGLICGACGGALVWFVVLRRPELLRSEQHTEIIRLIDIGGDKESTPEIRSFVSGAISRLSTSKRDVCGAVDGEADDA
jgi:hypothetical protein